MPFPPSGERRSGNTYIVLSAAGYMVHIAVTLFGHILKVIRMGHQTGS